MSKYIIIPDLIQVGLFFVCSKVDKTVPKLSSLTHEVMHFQRIISLYNVLFYIFAKKNLVYKKTVHCLWSRVHL